MFHNDQKIVSIEGFQDMMEYNSMLFGTGKIKGVPSVYVNGYHFPGTFDLGDIGYHISELEQMRQIVNEIEVYQPKEKGG